MLSRRALAVAVRGPPFPPRPLSTGGSPFPDGKDRISQLLGDDEQQAQHAAPSSPFADSNSNAPTEPEPTNPPTGPLPRRTAPTAARLKSAHSLPADRCDTLHVFASRNNTILTLTNSLGSPQAWVSAGRCGFKNVQRSSYEAGYRCAVRIFAAIEQLKRQNSGTYKLRVSFKGFGFGREAVYRALVSSEGDNIRENVIELRDATPLKIGGGTKAKKARRL